MHEGIVHLQISILSPKAVPNIYDFLLWNTINILINVSPVLFRQKKSGFNFQKGQRIKYKNIYILSIWLRLAVLTIPFLINKVMTTQIFHTSETGHY